MFESRESVWMTPGTSAYTLSETVAGGTPYIETEILVEPFKDQPKKVETPEWKVGNRIQPDDLPCPLGYSLSGDMCYENCPSNYRDNGEYCIRERYAVKRPSYDRGSGIPYEQKRSKSIKVYPIEKKCNVE